MVTIIGTSPVRSAGTGRFRMWAFVPSRSPAVATVPAGLDGC